MSRDFSDSKSRQFRLSIRPKLCYNTLVFLHFQRNMVRHMNEENIEAKQPRQRRLTKEQLAPGLILSLALSFLLGLYAPLDLYFCNI